MPTLLPAPSLSPLFDGPRFGDVLNRRTRDALAAVHALEPQAWEPVNGAAPDVVESIVSTWDIALPDIDWDAPRILVGATEDQRMRALITYTPQGSAAPLTWRPTTHLIGVPPAAFGLAGRDIAIVCEAHELEADAMRKAMTRAQRWIDQHRAFLWQERQEWRDNFARIVRDAVRKRRNLLDSLSTLTEVATR